MDIQMPDINGFEADRTISDLEISSGERTPIAAVAADARREDEEEGLAAGKAVFDVPSEIFDRNGLLEALGGDESYVEELVELFLDNEGEYMDSIRSAMETNDIVGLRAAAHTLQGVLASIQARSSRQVACRLEDISVTGDIADAPGALAALDIEMDRLRSALRNAA